MRLIDGNIVEYQTGFAMILISSHAVGGGEDVQELVEPIHVLPVWARVPVAAEEDGLSVLGERIADRRNRHRVRRMDLRSAGTFPCGIQMRHGDAEVRELADKAVAVAPARRRHLEEYGFRA